MDLNDDKLPPQIEPPQSPLTILDVDRANGAFDMGLPLSDPCPRCGAFNMHVGDWVCWGYCYPCFKQYDEDSIFVR